MIPLALAAILEDVRGHPGARSLGVGSVVSQLFFFLRHTQMQTYLIINMDDIVIWI